MFNTINKFIQWHSLQTKPIADYHLTLEAYSDVRNNLHKVENFENIISLEGHKAINRAILVLRTDYALKKGVKNIDAYNNHGVSQGIEKILRKAAGILNFDYLDHKIGLKADMKSITERLKPQVELAWNTLNLDHLNDREKNQFLSKIDNNFYEMRDPWVIMGGKWAKRHIKQENREIVKDFQNKVSQLN